MAYGQLVVLGSRLADGGRAPNLYVQPNRRGQVAVPALRVGMGALVGVVFGLASGNMLFWLVMGMALGGVFAALLMPAPLPAATVLCLPAPAKPRALPAYRDRSPLLSIREAA